MHCRPVALAAALILILATSHAAAQYPRASVTIKGGATVENSEDNLTGTVPALGAVAAWHVTRQWGVEVEGWLPGYLEDSRGEPRHRDILLTVSAVRSFGERAARPFLTAGVSFSRTEDRFTFCSANRPPAAGGVPVSTLVSCDAPDVVERRRDRNVGTDGYLSVGGGVSFRLTPRLDLVADVRVSLAPVSVLVRPGIGLELLF